MIPSVVYFIGGADMIKIGWSTNVDERLRTMQPHSPVTLVLLATVRGGVALEQQLHERFKKHRAHGEWFRRTPALEDAIEEALPGWKEHVHAKAVLRAEEVEKRRREHPSIRKEREAYERNVRRLHRHRASA